MRFFILQSHYRGTLDFTSCDGRRWKGYEKFSTRFEPPVGSGAGHGGRGCPRGAGSDPVRQSPSLPWLPSAFQRGDGRRFQYPQAIAVLFDAAREVNTLLASGTKDAAALSDYARFYGETADCVLGLVPVRGAAGAGGSGGPPIEQELLDLLVELRADVRKEKLFPLSDKIRDRLQGLGVTLEDKKEGTAWKRP